MNDDYKNKKITIGIELIDNPEWMGGMLYLRNLSLSLASLPIENRPIIRLLGPRPIITRFLDECNAHEIFREQTGETLLDRVLRKLGWNKARHNPIDVVYPGFGTTIPGAVTMRWIPDFQHRHLPELFSTQEIAARDASINALANSSGTVVFSSKVAANDFQRFFPGHRAIPRVWHFFSPIQLAPSAPPSRLHEEHRIPEKYLYLPNQFWAHKNHITVLKSLVTLRDQYRIIVPLVCSGAQSDRRNSSHFADLLEFVREHKLADQVWFLGLVPRAEQIDVFRRAAAVVQPSLFEGWSTVVEDTRAIGRPIFLSDIPVHREQAPPNGSFFSPESHEALAALLADTWAHLRPGPDLDAEAAALKQTRSQVRESALEFCRIAREALEAKGLRPSLGTG